MHLSNESLIVIVIVGIVAGWLAGNIVRGGGYGLIGDLIVDVIGAANWESSDFARARAMLRHRDINRLNQLAIAASTRQDWDSPETGSLPASTAQPPASIPLA
jgi:hypothetical protein